MHKYAELAKLATGYARRMNHLSNRIFGEVTRPTNSKSMRVCIIGFKAFLINKL